MMPPASILNLMTLHSRQRRQEGVYIFFILHHIFPPRHLPSKPLTHILNSPSNYPRKLSDFPKPLSNNSGIISKGRNLKTGHESSRFFLRIRWFSPQGEFRFSQVELAHGSRARIFLTCRLIMFGARKNPRVSIKPCRRRHCAYDFRTVPSFK